MEILEVVPDVVRQLAKVIEFGQDIGDRLIKDPRMEGPWRTMRKLAERAHRGGKLESHLASLDPLWRSETWEIPGLKTLEVQADPEIREILETLGTPEPSVTAPDRALAAFYACVVLELSVHHEPMTESGVSKMADEWRRAASLCRTAISFPGQAARDPKLGCALTTAAAYLDRIAQYIEGSARNNRAYFMRRFSRRAIARAARADTSSTTRARTRAVALGSKAIFGTRLADSRIVTVVSVALNVHVRLKSVENWCHDL